MNEQIESYLNLHHCHDYFNNYGESVEDDHYFMYREEVDGLIELIVRECFKAAMIESKGHMNPNDLLKRMKECVGVNLYEKDIQKSNE